MQGSRAWWDGLTQESRDFIVAVGATLAAALIGSTVYALRSSIAALIRRIFKIENPPAPTLVVQFPSPPEPPNPPAGPAKAAEATPPAHLPQIPRVPKTGFVARRDTEGNNILERLIDELAPEKRQLLALCGAGGVGKTTLAAEAVRALSDTFARRVAWVSADGRPDFTLSTLLDGIAVQLGRDDLRPLPLEQKEERLRALLAESPTLVVLDNFETVAEAEQESCADWLANRAPCSAVITARGDVSHARHINILAMSLPEAREFVKRLIEQARHPRSFEGLNHDEIIAAADRNPLVLQWVIKQIDQAKQPRTALSELARGASDAAERVFGRSFQLLSDDGRAALLALSLFVPSASRAALAEVAGFGQDAPRLDAAAAQLAELWLANMTEGNERLTVEGLTRELAKSHLARDKRAGKFHQRFVAYFMEYAQAHAQRTPEDFDALEAERENLLAAIDAAFEGKQWQSVRVIRYALNAFLEVRGYWDEAIRRGQQAVEAAHVEGDEREAAGFSLNVAIIRFQRGEYDAARQSYSQTIAAFKKVGDDLNVAGALHNLALIEQYQGEVDKARHLYAESLEISKRLGSQPNVAYTLHQLATLAHEQGAVDEARHLYAESLEISKRLGDQSRVSSTLHGLGRLARERGELDEARHLYAESLEISKRLRNQIGIASTTREIGIVHFILNEFAESRAKHEESLAISRRIGDQLGIASDLGQMGIIAAAEGDKAEAARLYREALSIFERLGSHQAEIVRWNLERLEGSKS